MGILNVTPDSFSDGGQFFDARGGRSSTACSWPPKGADILDIGGESTRPYCRSRSTADEELDRVLPVITALRRQLSIPISIDTSKAAVARAGDRRRRRNHQRRDRAATAIREMLDVARQSRRRRVRRCTCRARRKRCRTIRRTTTSSPKCFDYLRQRRDALLAAGIEPARIASIRASASARRTSTI